MVNFPLFGEKQKNSALFTPKDNAAYEKEQGRYPDAEPPEGVILTFQKSLFNQILSEDGGEKITGLDECFDLYYLEGSGGSIGVAGRFGIGAPAMALVVEELVEYGVESFLIIEYAGCLDPNMSMNDIVICDRALRDEGTSYHYIPDSRYVEGTDSFINSIEHTLSRLDITYHVGPSWTIDALYRESAEEVRQYLDEGVITVDMEAAALYAIGEYRDVDVGAMFVVSDFLSEDEWDPQFHSTEENLNELYELGRKSLSQHIS